MGDGGIEMAIKGTELPENRLSPQDSKLYKSVQ